jgi:hypothetical protein
MGAWGHGSTENDEALEWIANHIEEPIITSIKECLEGFLADPSDDIKKHEAEAAVALLIDFTANLGSLKRCPINITQLAESAGLWDLGIQGIQLLRADHAWLQEWTTPTEKLAVLNALLSELASVKEKSN